MNAPNKIVLAYSGGLDTSVILRWLQKTYECDVVAFIADIGQLDDLDAIAAKAERLGASQVFVEDLVEEFAENYVFPMFRANALYEGEYLLGTSIARPLIAARMIEIANEVGADANSHGATGKGTDQVRCELGAYAMKPEIKIIAPWRVWDFRSRRDLVAFAEQEKIEIETREGGEADYSVDANLLHISYEGGELENPWSAPPPNLWRWTVNPEQAPDEAQSLTLSFAQGNLTAIDRETGTAAQLFRQLNAIGAAHGIGRIDIVENRYVGMKSRGCYETPGGTILHRAHRAMESITLDREVAHLKDELVPRFSEMVYNGYWWSPERLAIQQLIDETQRNVTGDVRLSLYKGSVIVTGRRSKQHSLYDEAVVSFDDESGAYAQADADGFIKLNALRLRVGATKNR